MAKRRQTTGLPKQKPAAPSDPEQGRVRKSRAERESEVQRYILIGTGVAVGVVILILALAIIVELFVNPNQVVATVNDDTITVSEFQDRVRLERALLNLQINNFVANLSASGLDPNQFAGQEPLRTWLSQVQIPDQLGNSVVNTMVDNLLVRQQAEAMDISVSQEDIDRVIEDFLGYNPDLQADAAAEETATVEPTITPTPFVSPTPSPAPTLTPTSEATEEATEEATAEATDETDAVPTFTPVPPTPTLTAEEQAEEFITLREDFYSRITSSARISRQQLTSYFETLALREALAEEVSDLTNELPHVNARHILVNTEEEAQEIMAALEAGESFVALAAAESTDTGSGANGGELGWAAVTDFVGPFSEAAANAEIGALTGPVESEFGWHIIQVHARENRTVTDQQLDTAKTRAFTQWLDNLRDSEDVTVEISSIWADHVPDDPAFVLNAGV